MRYTLLLLVAGIIPTMQLYADLYARFLFQRSITDMNQFMYIDRHLACYPKQTTPGKKLFPVRDRYVHNQEKNELISKLIKTYNYLSDDDKKRYGIKQLLENLLLFEKKYNIRVQKYTPSPSVIAFGASVCMITAVSIIIHTCLFAA